MMLVIFRAGLLPWLILSGNAQQTHPELYFTNLLGHLNPVKVAIKFNHHSRVLHKEKRLNLAAVLEPASPTSRILFSLTSDDSLHHSPPLCYNTADKGIGK
jgi:hypothetical protein